MKNLRGKTILVTGANGFVGSHLIRRLKEMGCVIHALCRTKIVSNGDGIHWINLDMSDMKRLRKVFTQVNPDIVFHLASHVTGNRALHQLEPTLKSNLVSTINLLALVAEFNCDRIVTVGSMEEPHIDSNDVPSSPYSAAKWASTGYSRMFFNLYNIPVVTATLFMIYGPGQKDKTKLIPYVTNALLLNSAPKLSSGTRDIDWIYIDDVIEGLIQMAITPGIEGKIIDIGSGKTHTIREVVEKIVELTKPDVMPQFNALPDRPLESTRVADVKLTGSLIKWKPRVSLHEGLSKTVKWYRENLHKANGKDGIAKKTSSTVK
jgi:nucleoside-diphosphate-sugar epimerase